ncbi:HD domain-containing phosphohydrolase [Hartmannibacter diazotrophicus]|uniref:response regulator n=1 Tax=Hartmannibacter diazotrophicus TaxID=1482074 RepID=UPI0013903931|nr:HD domain-containing phosphohydrolase [Hartmannibacter diazotrophicus]
MEILIVDDNRTSLTYLRRLVEQVDGCTAQAFLRPEDAFAHASEHGCDVLFVDFRMPGMDGITLLRQMRQWDCMAGVPAVMITSEEELGLRQSALDVGATSFMKKPIDPVEFRTRLKNLIALRRAHNAETHRAQWLSEEVAKATRTIAAREEELIMRLARAVELRDGGTGEHIDRIAHFSQMIGEAIGLDDEALRTLFLASPMHDIGKLSVPDSILLKPGRLTDEERAVMQRHTTDGFKILENSEVPLLKSAADIALGHHEHFDGNGYPHGLQKTDIPLPARIVAVADVFDALTSVRPYKDAWPIERAIDHMRQQSGKHFDPACLDAFEKRLDDIVVFRQEADDPVGTAA